jgi:hypothetical protein
MWTMIGTLECVVDELAPAFTQPSYGSAAELLLGWIMCLAVQRYGGRLRDRCFSSLPLAALCRDPAVP